jgi:arsenate reductase (thioredoxin)
VIDGGFPPVVVMGVGGTMERKPKVLFFSTGDASRSQMAERFLEEVTHGEIAAESTAVESVDVSPTAVEVMNEVGIDLMTHEAKPVAESLKEHFAFVVTMSDDAKERSPVWPFTRNIVHWNMPDPASEEGIGDWERDKFRQVRDDISRRVTEFSRRFEPQLQGATGDRSP